jgi:hypothetical protein
MAAYCAGASGGWAAYQPADCYPYKPRDNGWFNIPPGVNPVLVSPNFTPGVFAGINDPHPRRSCSSNGWATGCASYPAPRMHTAAMMSAPAAMPAPVKQVTFATAAAGAQAGGEGPADTSEAAGPAVTKPSPVAMAAPMNPNDRYAAQAANLQMLAAKREAVAAAASAAPASMPMPMQMQGGAGAGMSGMVGGGAGGRVSSEPPGCVIM